MLQIAIATWLLLMLTPVTTIYNDHGGFILDYAIKAAKLRKRGEGVRFVGRCYSACTIYLSLPNNCIAPNADLGFHLPSGSDPKHRKIALDYLIRIYPNWVKNWLVQKGELSTRLIHMPSSYAINYISTC